MKNEVIFDENLASSEDIDFIGQIIRNHNCCLVKEYLYYHNKGYDNLYNFYERAEADLQMIIHSSELVGKFTRSDIGKIEMYKKRIHAVKNDSNFSTSNSCIKNSRKKIGMKYYTLGLISQHMDKKTARLYILKSLFYNFQIRHLVTYIKFFNPLRKKDIIVKESELYFS